MPTILSSQPALCTIQSLREMPVLNAEHRTEQEIIEIYLIIQGHVKILCRDHGVELQSNMLYCKSSSRQEKAMVGEGSKGYVIRFSKSLLYSSEHEWYNPSFTDFYAMVLRGEALRVNDSFWENGIKIGEMMRLECKGRYESNTQIVTGLLSLLLLHIMRLWNASVSNSVHGSKHALIRKFNVLLEEKFKTKKKVADYAALLYVTPSYLNDIIKQATGNSASFHIKQRVMMEAVRQAKLTGASMKEVAWRLGFNDNAHFSKFFKKVAGTNFSDMRRVGN